MSTKFIRVTTDAGIQFVSEFHKLGKPQAYAQKVFRDKRPFNVWHVTSTVHPDSGEKVLFRTRQLLNGEHIIGIEVVERNANADADSYHPTDFHQVPVMEKTQFGTWDAPTATGELVEDARPGATYPIRRDDGTLRRYVVLKAGDVDGDGEIRHYLDPESEYARTAVTVPNEDEDDFEVEDDDYEGE